jgi:hypothetical protein
MNPGAGCQGGGLGRRYPGYGGRPSLRQHEVLPARLASEMRTRARWRPERQTPIGGHPECGRWLDGPRRRALDIEEAIEEWLRNAATPDHRIG